MYNVFLLLGAPGAGKGTLASLLQNKYSLPHISTGDLLRHEVNSGSNIGLQVAESVSKGILISDALMTRILESHLFDKGKEGFILDGYPRNMNQALLLNDLFSRIEIINYLVIDVFLEEKAIIGRILDRSVCNNCGAVYNKKLKLPIVSGMCDICGGKDFSDRDDDTIQVVMKRLSVYKEHAEDLLNYYKKESKQRLVRVRGDWSQEEILSYIDSMCN